MPANRPAAKTLFIVLLAIAGVALVYTLYENRPWKIPEEAKQRQNPIQPSAAALASAQAIYHDKCANCHGDRGKGDGPDAGSYYPRPSSLVDEHMRDVSDGELFYKISEGRKPMPAFKKKLTEEQRWQLVLLIRTLARADAPTR